MPASRNCPKDGLGDALVLATTPRAPTIAAATAAADLAPNSRRAGARTCTMNATLCTSVLRRSRGPKFQEIHNLRAFPPRRSEPYRSGERGWIKTKAPHVLAVRAGARGGGEATPSTDGLARYSWVVPLLLRDQTSREADSAPPRLRGTPRRLTGDRPALMDASHARFSAVRAYGESHVSASAR